MNMIISKATTEFEVLTTITEPKVGDKWEDNRNIYTITSVKRLYLTQLPVDRTEYYIVNLDVWGKDICSPDEPETILMEYDEYLAAECDNIEYNNSFTDKDLEKIKRKWLR